MSKSDGIKVDPQKPILEMNVRSREDAEFRINYEILPASDGYFNTQEINFLRQQYQTIQSEMDVLLKERERLTNHADALDYEVAVACGFLCGLVDVFFVGELDLSKAHEWGSEKINKFVLRVANHTKGTNGQPYKGNDIEGAIRHLENKFVAPSDSVTAQFGGGRQHHLRDFAHHPSVTGLIFSLLTQFTTKAYGTDTSGGFIVVNITNTTFIGKDLPEKLLFGIVYWFFHMISDMAGSSSFAGGGTGLPGSLLSLAKLLSSCPIFVDENGVNTFSLWITKAFNGTLTAQRDETGKLIKESINQIDLRTELGIVKQQAFSVILNEVLVRAFYFISRVHRQVKEKEIRHINELDRLDWDKCIPVRNRTIIRMLTIASSTFMAVDLADAAIRSASKSGGNVGAFVGQMLLRVNFVGIGRTVIAIGTDLIMEWERGEIQKDINCVLVKELHAYTDLLRAERIELEKIVCWGIVVQINEVNSITMAIEAKDTNAVDTLTDQYLEKYHLNTQFGNFDEFQKFMMSTDEDLIL